MRNTEAAKANVPSGLVSPLIRGKSNTSEER